MVMVIRKILLGVLGLAAVCAGVCIIRSRRRNRWMDGLERDTDW